MQCIAVPTVHTLSRKTFNSVEMCHVLSHVKLKNEVETINFNFYNPPFQELTEEQFPVNLTEFVVHTSSKSTDVSFLIADCQSLTNERLF